MKKWTVIGVYEEDFHKFADHVEAFSAGEAIRKVLADRKAKRRVHDDDDADQIIIAGVVAGHVRVEG